MAIAMKFNPEETAMAREESLLKHAVGVKLPPQSSSAAISSRDQM